MLDQDSAAAAVAATPWQRFGAAIYDPFLALGERRGMTARRARLLAAAHGRVLEIGAGTGLNLARYPAGLEELVLTEPDPGMAARLRRRLAAGGGPGDVPLRVVQAPAEALPFGAASFDTVVSTMVLCTAPEPAAVLAELRRVLAPGGRLVLAEHVLSARPGAARWQRRLAAPWAAFAAGCRCDQDTVPLLEAAGFGVSALAAEEWRGMPRIVRPLVTGALAADGPRR